MLAWKQEMLKRLKKAILRSLQQLAQEVLKRTTQESPAESSHDYILNRQTQVRG